MKNIILLAVQGAGKGTIAALLKEKYGYVHISTGDILRRRAEIGDDLGLEIKNLIDRGILVSDDIIFKAIKDHITMSDCDNGYILDGIPRTLSQAIKYDELMNELNKDIGVVINLTIPEEILIKRITSRRICSSCGKIYSTSYKDAKPKISGKCDDCKGELILRSDDADIKAIEKRINTYHENAKAMLDFYKKRRILYNIDSTDTKKAIRDVEKLI